MKDGTGVTEMKKRQVVLLVLLIGFGIITTSYAFTVTTISTTAEFVDSPRSDSDRGVSLYEAYPLGKNSVYVKFQLGLDPAGPDQHANVEVRIMPLDGSNNVLTSADGSTTMQQKIDAGGWGDSGLTFTTGDEIVWEYSVANTNAIDIYITFEEGSIASSFVTCMIEIREYN